MYGGGGGSSYLEGEKMMPRQKTPAASRREGGGKQAAPRELKRSVSMGGKLASAAREQRARLYIMRRCVSMLVRWKD
ncbi:hypothetical protein ACP70R_007909 [Stipagrostis hirtigluma subsp. patula]